MSINFPRIVDVVNHKDFKTRQKFIQFKEYLTIVSSHILRNLCFIIRVVPFWIAICPRPIKLAIKSMGVVNADDSVEDILLLFIHYFMNTHNSISMAFNQTEFRFIKMAHMKICGVESLLKHIPEILCPVDEIFGLVYTCWGSCEHSPNFFSVTSNKYFRDLVQLV